MTESLLGHLPAAHPLSIRQAARGAIFLGRYEPLSMWEQDTLALPRSLRGYRRKLRSFAREHLQPRARAGDSLTPDKAELETLLSIAARAGLLSDSLPRPLGSASLRLIAQPLQFTTCIKMEELCTACGGLGLAIGAHSLGTAPLVLSGRFKDIWRLLLPAYRRSRSGQPTLFAFALTEPSAGSDMEDGHGAAKLRPGTVARRVEGGYLLTGRKVFISGGDRADAISVFSALEGEGMPSWTCFYVEARSPGFRVVRSELKMGQRASSAAELQFDGVFVPDRHVIGELRKGWALNRVTLNFSRLPTAAVALGIARGALEAAVDFACQQRLGGRPLIDYQEVQLAVVQMIAETSAMRALIWQSAARFTPTQAKASLAKFHCSDRAVEVCNLAMNLLGNHGILPGNRVEKDFRDARLTQIYEGTNDINRLAVMEDLQEQFLERVTP